MTRSKDQMAVEWCMKAAGQEVREYPHQPSYKERELRANLILEEAIETVNALGFQILRKNNIVWGSSDVTLHPMWKGCDTEKVADGCADVIVVALGTLSAYGIDADSVLEEVHRANRDKFPGGKAILREDGKYLKPDGWRPPEIAGVLKSQGWQG
jgi:predicted HAD superfamily Cof-like phosphohydrolase